MSIIIVAGARPNFVKIAPIIWQFIQNNISFSFVHTGQHYSDALNTTFLADLNIPNPDINLQAGSGTQAEQTAIIMTRFENYLRQNPSPLVLVVGDVTSTMACSIVAKKMNRTLLHVEAGLRSFDRTMPEEINRILTDSIADYFYTTSSTANNQLIKEGITASNIQLVGNTMIDSLLSVLPNIKKPAYFNDKNIQHHRYILLTLHRPSNVDNEKKIREILNTLNEHSSLPILFSVHPRNNHAIIAALKNELKNIHFIPPLSYLEFIYAMKYATGVITDSGGIQEETTILNIPCLTYRENTERPETIALGTNKLVPNLAELIEDLKIITAGNWKKGIAPPFWDGKASERIVNHIKLLLKKANDI